MLKGYTVTSFRSLLSPTLKVCNFQAHRTHLRNDALHNILGFLGLGASNPTLCPIAITSARLAVPSPAFGQIVPGRSRSRLNTNSAIMTLIWATLTGWDGLSRFGPGQSPAICNSTALPVYTTCGAINIAANSGVLAYQKNLQHYHIV